MLIISYVFLGIVAVLFLIILLGIRMIQEYEKAVIFRLGRCVGAKGPGLFYIVPFIDRCQVTDMRTETIEIQKQETITSDSVSLNVAAVLFFKIVDASKSVIAVEDFLEATEQLAIATLRSVIGKHSLTNVLSNRDAIKDEIKKIVDEQTEKWGIVIESVEIRDLEIPENMKRAMAQKAEAEREREARVTRAEGEYESAKRLAEAAKILDETPGAMKLRELDTMLAVGKENNSTIIFMEKATSALAQALAAGRAGVQTQHAQPPVAKTKDK